MIGEQHAHAMSHVQQELEAGVQAPILSAGLPGLQPVCLQAQLLFNSCSCNACNHAYVGYVHPRNTMQTLVHTSVCTYGCMQRT